MGCLRNVFALFKIEWRITFEADVRSMKTQFPSGKDIASQPFKDKEMTQ